MRAPSLRPLPSLAPSAASVHSSGDDGGHSKDPHAPSGLLVVVRLLRKNWLILLVTALLGCGVGLLQARSQPKIYQAAALLELDVRTIRPLADKTAAMQSDAFWDNREYYETQLRIITSDRVLARVVRDQGLATDPAFLGHKSNKEVSVPSEDAAAILRGRIVVEPVRNSRLLYIRYEDTDPKRAKRICDGIASAFITQNLEKTIAATSDAVVWLNGQVDHYRRELQESENHLHAFKDQHKLPSTSINESSNMIRIEMQAATESLERLQRAKDDALARHRQITEAIGKVDRNNPRELPATEFLASSHVQFLRQRFEQALAERAELVDGQKKGPNHDDVRSVDRRILEIKNAIWAELTSIQSASARELKKAESQVGATQGRLEDARRRAIELTQKEIEYRRLDRSREQNEKLFSMLLERMKEADLARMMNVNELRLVDAPTEPKVPIRPRVPAIAALGALAGLLVGVSAAFAREQLDSTVKTPEDVEGRLGLPFLGLLPSLEEDEKSSKRRRSRRDRAPIPDMAPELRVHAEPRGQIAEAARSLRTNILFMNPDNPYRMLLVSSAAPSEGKTMVACSIAIALAQGGQRVCIVDCDLRRPRLHRIFGRGSDEGVSTYILGQATVPELAKPTVVENLWSIPCGPIPPNPADLLHSERFKKFLSDLRENFDRVVIDSPPLAAVTDSAILSTLVDGTVYVIRAFETSFTLSRQGVRSLFDVDARVVGAVLNAVDFDTHEYKYNHYYYYYRRDGYGANSPSAPGPEPQEPAA